MTERETVGPITIREGAELELAAPQYRTEVILDTTQTGADVDLVAGQARLARMWRNGRLDGKRPTGTLAATGIMTSIATSMGAGFGYMIVDKATETGDSSLWPLLAVIAVITGGPTVGLLLSARSEWRDYRAGALPYVVLTTPVGVVESDALTPETRALLLLNRSEQRAAERGAATPEFAAQIHHARVRIAHIQNLRAHLRGVAADEMETHQLAAVVQHRALLDNAVVEVQREVDRLVEAIGAAGPAALPTSPADRRAALDAVIESGDALADRIIAASAAAELTAEPSRLQIEEGR